MRMGRPTWIYVVSAVGTSYFKVGLTQWVDARVTELQVGCPHRLEVLTFTRGEAIDEHRLLNLMAPWRARGEWFYLGVWSSKFAELVSTLGVAGIERFVEYVPEQARLAQTANASRGIVRHGMLVLRKATILPFRVNKRRTKVSRGRSGVTLSKWRKPLSH